MCYTTRMASKKQQEKDKEITVIAEVEVASEGKVQTVKGFDASWKLALELPVPVTVKMVGWARIN